MSSEVSAKAIERAVLDALQNADELGGPERGDYIRMMERIAAVCTARAETARLNAPEQVMLRWARESIHPEAYIDQTGGGCTALAIPGAPESGVAFWYITDENTAPEAMTPQSDDLFCVGAYDDEGAQIFYALVPSMGDARYIVQRCKATPR